ncbi:MAG: hypothetical protein E4G99_09155 [Anaerolineales bacterium]|nr:MAG: hypothetical protein E4G99_09155 [Anaerolineales bacterium]
MSTLALSGIHPGWRGSLISSDFNALTRGIECERARLFGLSFITLRFVQDYDYDGVAESLQLLEGFSDEARAIQYVDQMAEQALTASLAEPRWRSSDWHLYVSSDYLRIQPDQEGSLVRCVHQRSFKMTLEHGFELKNFRFEVLCVELPEVIGPDLFTYCDAEAEWVDYFISKGEE